MNVYQVYYSMSMQQSKENSLFKKTKFCFIDFTLHIKFVSIKISMARIFPSNLISHIGVNSNDISQSILISSSLRKTRMSSDN